MWGPSVGTASPVIPAEGETGGGGDRIVLAAATAATVGSGEGSNLGIRVTPGCDSDTLVAPIPAADRGDADG